jgi:hypothetical protein
MIPSDFTNFTMHICNSSTDNGAVTSLIYGIEDKENSKQNSLASLIQQLMNTEEQKDSAFLLFFASQNDVRYYNALPKDKFFVNIESYSLNSQDFGDYTKGDGGKIHDAIESALKLTGASEGDKVKKLNVLMSGTGGQIDAAKFLHMYLRERFNEINVYVYKNAGSALAMIALSADKLYMQNDPESEDASISKLDFQLPYWRYNNEDSCLDMYYFRQVSFERLVAAFDDKEKYKQFSEEAGHGYLYGSKFRKTWKKEFESLYDSEHEPHRGIDVFNAIPEEKIIAMYGSYTYFRNEIGKLHPKTKFDALTAPTFDLLAEHCEFGKGMRHHGSNMHTDDLHKLDIDFTCFNNKSKEDGSNKSKFYETLGKINKICEQIVELDDVKKLFAFAHGDAVSDIYLCTERHVKPISSIPEYYDAVRTIHDIEKENKAITGNKLYLGFRGQDRDYGFLSPSIFRDNIPKPENKLYEESIKNCDDILGQETVIPDNTPVTLINVSKQQHYGVPTRFLDITSCPLFALYFACAEEEIEFNDKVESNENGVVYVFPFTDRERSSRFFGDKAEVFSQLVHLSDGEKTLLYKKIKRYKREIALLKRYFNYIYSLASICDKENFLRADYTIPAFTESPYVTSLKERRKKIAGRENKGKYLPEAVFLYDNVIQLIENFANYSDADYIKNRTYLLKLIDSQYKLLKPMFYNLICNCEDDKCEDDEKNKIRCDDIIYKLFGFNDEANVAIDLFYAEILFSIDEELPFMRDLSEFNKRLKRQKGMFVISGLHSKVNTAMYHKIIISKENKAEIFEKLKKSEFTREYCPWRNDECSSCSCEDGFSFVPVYGDLYGQGRAIEKYKNIVKTNSHRT